jgi:hypothetical protein
MTTRARDGGELWSSVPLTRLISPRPQPSICLSLATHQGNRDPRLLGELLPISSVVLVVGFVAADLGHPERFWHMLPFVREAGLPACGALVSWGIMAMNEIPAAFASMVFR